MFSRFSCETILAAFCLFVLMIFCGVDPVPGLRILLVLIAQIFTGGEIYRYFRKSGQLSLIEYTAFGFSLGSLTWLIGDQIFIYLSLPKFGWALPFVVVMFWRLRPKQHVRSQLKVDWIAIKWIVIAALLGLSGEWVWTLPFSLFVIAVNLIFSSSRINITKKVTRLISSLLIILSAVITVATRPKVWWISQGDTHFYEGLTKSVAKWGWHESIFSSGFSLQYHWFPYAWSGLVTRLADAPDWVVLTRVGVLIPALCVIAFVWIISTRLSTSLNASIVGVLLLAASSVFGEWFVVIPLAMIGSFSQLFATIWLLPVLIWAIDVGSGLFTKSWLFLTLLFVGLVGGKVSHAAVAAAFILAFQAARLLRDRALYKTVAAEVSAILLTMFVTSRVLFGSGGSLSPRPAAWAPYLQGDLYAFYGRSLWIAATILALGMTYLAVSTLICGVSLLRGHSSIYFGLITALVAGFGFSHLSSGPTSPNGLFFLHASVVLVNSVLGVVVVGLWNRSEKLSISETISCVLIAVIALLSIYLIPNRDSGANSAIWFRTLRSLVVLIPFVFTFLFFAVRKSGGYLVRVSKGLLLASITISVTTFIATNGSSYSRDMDGFTQNSVLYLPSKDLIELRDWLRINSKDSDVYASNYVCEGEDCTAPQLSQRALLSTTIERRALIESPWIASAFTEPSSRDGAGNLAERLKYSANFADTPSSQISDFLRGVGVRWYIVDLGRTNNGLWQIDASNVFSNQSFVLIDLEKFEI